MMQNIVRRQHHPFKDLLHLIVACLMTIAFAQGVHTYLTSEADSDAPRRQSQDTGGQAASPNPGKGFDQQEKVRQQLAKHYDTLYADEASIQKFLNMRGPTADFLGRNTTTHRWLIAESKASDINKAWRQLENTAQALVKAQPGAEFDLRLYLDTRHYEMLSKGSTISNWAMKDGFVGWID